MNICFPSLTYPVNGYASSGVGSQVQLLAHNLIDAGNSISVVDLAAKDEATQTDDHGAQILRMKSGKLHWYAGKLPLIGTALALPIREIEYSLTVWRGIRRAKKTIRLDLIEGTETGMLLVALLEKETPLLIRLHGEQYTFHKYTPGLRLSWGVRLSRILQRIALRRAKLLVSPSYAHAQEIQRELDSPHPPIVVVPNGLNIEKTNGESSIERNQDTVLYVGRIERRKGIATLLQAAAQAKQSLPKSRFVFAGDFHSSFSQSEFEALVNQHNLTSQVEVLGPIKWKELSDWYRRSAISVLPSHYETFGVAALEPMVFGTPVIATSGGALSEVVESEVSGRLVAAGDSVALAGALTDLLTDTRSREQMGRAAIERAEEFNIRRLMPLNAKVYEWCAKLDDSAGPHVFFSPHLDDAVLSCGGKIHSLVAQSKSVRVVTVFAGESKSELSAFARHLHAKWNSKSDLFEERRREDVEAFTSLGVQDVQQWNLLEAPYRVAADGRYLYGTYEELHGQLASEDEQTKHGLIERIQELLADLPETATLYFPLSLGRHVDHQLLFAAGLELNAAGRRVCFYEDYPYAENYQLNNHEFNWLPRNTSISIEPKLKAASSYTTQLRGLGGSARNLERRMRAFGTTVGGDSVSERYWQILTPALTSNQNQIASPLATKSVTPRFRDFKDFLKTFRWGDLDELFPVGGGECLDLGCGAGRYKTLIENKGYRWIGVDESAAVAVTLRSDAAAVSLRSNSVSAVVAWQVLEYLPRPEDAIAEAARVLETGGVFCGSVSFLEPVHGRTYFNMSPLALEKLLTEHGFGDIEIKPGLNGFALMLWTWLRRSAIPFADRLAIPVAFAMFAPLALVMFLVSWLGLRLGLGTGHIMEWLSKRAPLEFAGHLMFSARKKARTQNCTSDS